MMVGTNLTDVQLQQLVDRTIIKADKDFDGKISFDEFKMVSKEYYSSWGHHLICFPLDDQGSRRRGEVDSEVLSTQAS